MPTRDRARAYTLTTTPTGPVPRPSFQQRNRLPYRMSVVRRLNNLTGRRSGAVPGMGPVDLVFGPIAITYNIKGVSTRILTDPLPPRFSTAPSPCGMIHRSKPSTPVTDLPPTPTYSAATSPVRRTTSTGRRIQRGKQRRQRNVQRGVGVGASGNNGSRSYCRRPIGRSPANEWSFAVGVSRTWPRTRRRVRSSGDRFTESVGKTTAGLSSWDKATTWY